MEIMEPSVIPTREQVIEDLMDALAEIEPNPVESVQSVDIRGVSELDGTNVKKDSTDSEVEFSSDSDESDHVKPNVSSELQAKIDRILKEFYEERGCKKSSTMDKSCNPQISMNSSSDAEGLAAKQTTESDLNKGVSDHVPGAKPLGAIDSMQGATGVGEKK